MPMRGPRTGTHDQTHSLEKALDTKAVSSRSGTRYRHTKAVALGRSRVVSKRAILPYSSKKQTCSSRFKRASRTSSGAFALSLEFGKMAKPICLPRKLSSTFRRQRKVRSGVVVRGRYCRMLFCR